MLIHMRNSKIAIFINKLSRIFWFIARPTTKGVKALIFNNEGKVLMVRLTYYSNTWTFPGGGVHKNESETSAIIRECKEEVGVVLKSPEYIGSLYFEHEYKKDTVFVFKEKIDDLTIRIDGKEVAEAGWYSLDKLPNMGGNAKKIIDLAMKA